MLYVRRGSNCAFAVDFFSQMNFRRPAGAKDSGNGAKAASCALFGAGVCTEWSYAGVEECRRQASAARPSVSGLWKAGFLEE